MLLILMTLAATFQSRSGDDWKAVKPADIEFAAEMPAEAKFATKPVPNEQGGSFRVDHDTGRSEGVTYAIQAMLHSGPIPDAARETILDRDSREYVAARRGEVVRSDEIDFDGRPGWDETFAAPSRPARGAST